MKTKELMKRKSEDNLKSKSKNKKKRKNVLEIPVVAEVSEQSVPTVRYKDIGIDCELDRIEEQIIETLFEFNRSSNQINDSSVFALIVKSKKNLFELNLKLNKLQSKEQFWKEWIQSIDDEFESTLSGVKSKKWCSECHSDSNRRFDCCFNGFYCGFAHKKNDKNHFLNCRRVI